MGDYYRKALEAAEFIQSKLSLMPKIAVVLGSGLGSLADKMQDVTMIAYEDIPHFPKATVQGHAGKLICGMLGGKAVLAMKGRFHYYEGHDMDQVVFHTRVFRLIGITTLIVTNAAGGVNKSFAPGDLMLITDHISFFAPSPLRGKNMEEFGVRFPDMNEAYSRVLLKTAREVAKALGYGVKEGVYAFAQGPMYETPAEIKALALLGADAVGMSTVPEVIAARHAGLQVLGISCITNMAAGILDQPLMHEEVIETAKRVEQKFEELVKGIIEKM